MKNNLFLTLHKKIKDAPALLRQAVLSGLLVIFIWIDFVTPAYIFLTGFYLALIFIAIWYCDLFTALVVSSAVMLISVYMTWLNTHADVSGIDMAAAFLSPICTYLAFIWLITNLKNAARKLDNEQNYSAQVLESLPGIFYMLDQQGLIVRVNSRFQEILGYEPDELIGIPAICLIQDSHRDEVASTIQAVFQVGNGSVEAGVLTKSGMSIPFYLSGHRTIIDGQNYIAGMGIDLTDRVQIERELTTNQERLSLALSAANQGWFELDLHSGNAQVSPGYVQMLGFDPKTFRSGFDEWKHSIHPDDLAELMATFNNCLKKSGSCTMDYRRATASGDWKWIRSVGKIVEWDHDHLPVKMVGIHTDITEQKLLEQGQERMRGQLQQAQKMEAIGQLTGGIAHDFNNILAAILGYTDLALNRCVPDKESKLASYLREVQTAGERARDLIAKMLAFSRGAKGESIAMDVAPLVKEVSKTLRSVIPSTIELDSRIEEGLPPILGDPVQLHQVLMNLAINARDAIGEHGRIEIKLAHIEQIRATCASCHQDFEGDYIELSVSDSGHGIPPEILSRIFDPFFTTKEVGKGTGMGLSMVHGIMQQHGGHILVQSVVGTGTTFRLLFPVANLSDQSTIGSTTPKQNFARSSPANVLIVDDDVSIGHMLGEVLEAQGHKATIYSDSEQALTAVLSAPNFWDLVITDMTMPKVNGIELAAKILKLRPDMPIFLCTGFSEKIDEMQTRKLGIKRIFQKPLNNRELLNEISDVHDNGEYTEIAP